jgi:signal transduction histidine kinase
MLIAAQLLHHRSEDEVVRQAAARMLSSGKRMSRMIDSMLDLARARLAGGIPLTMGPADFGILVDRVVHEHEVAFPDGRIEVRQDGDLKGEWDADRLAQVTSNLIGNALQYGKAGEPVQVGLDGTRTDVVMLRIANAGSIAPDVLPHVFDPFRGGQRPADRKDGLGLGLYIVQQIVHAHRGSVNVQSADGKSTLFSVTVPRTAQDMKR